MYCFRKNNKYDWCQCGAKVFWNLSVNFHCSHRQLGRTGSEAGNSQPRDLGPASQSDCPGADPHQNRE
ncbi:hypothetical protein MATL_G00042160 [Megalops atlanticus]|uniref:Uncharacterized protein n=1 Tax=Megalops atlanticus TaxID=7932 RepID=A0A9D3QEJ5_MEGAT|nr:hypothetical protein MATL_G00042160 [Megalops atlanticus]